MTLYKKPFENIVWKGEMPVTSIFSFSYNVFYALKSKMQFFCHIYFVCKCFEFGPLKNRFCLVKS